MVSVKMIGPSKEVAEAYLHHTLQKSYGDATKLSSNRNNNNPDLTDVSQHPLMSLTHPWLTIKQNISFRII